MRYFKGLMKGKTHYFTRLLRSKSHFSLLLGARRDPPATLRLGRQLKGGGRSFIPRKVFWVKSEALLLSREMPAESAHRADWSGMVSHIYLELLLAQVPRWVGYAVRQPGVSEGTGGAAEAFPACGLCRSPALLGAPHPRSDIVVWPVADHNRFQPSEPQIVASGPSPCGR